MAVASHLFLHCTDGTRLQNHIAFLLRSAHDISGPWTGGRARIVSLPRYGDLWETQEKAIASFPPWAWPWD